LLRKVYAKRAAIRGRQPSPMPEWTQPFQEWRANDTEEYHCLARIKLGGGSLK